jgi:aconitate hydratase
MSTPSAGPVSTFTCESQTFQYVDLRAFLGASIFDRLPYAARVLAENVLRKAGADALRRGLDATAAAEWPLYIPRVILPDSSGIPVLMDLAALRSAVARRGQRADLIRSTVPIALVVDHSLQVDVAGTAEAPELNLEREYARNSERYRFLKWAQQAFPGTEIFPPGSGIIHQVHLERVAEVVCVDRTQDVPLAFPDMVVGGDSHTPMVNALGVLGWGVGGLEAEMAVLGEPYPLARPEFVGVELSGALGEGVTTTDLALTLTYLLRQQAVIGAFVEFFGPAVPQMSVPDRATLANMAPEYGATSGFWPVDDQTLAYLALTGRSQDHVDLVEAHAKAAGLFREASSPTPAYDRIVRLDLGTVTRSIAGPSKPHNLGAPQGLSEAFLRKVGALPATALVAQNEHEAPDGAVAIAAITSCTNTANPAAIFAASLLARNALARGLKPPAWVKTSFAPGSRAVPAYLARAGLLAPLEALGFHVIGFGCTTCGGKSGPLASAALEAIEHGRRCAAVLSGNRNFDGRIHRLIPASFLASPSLVVAYALAGTVLKDIDTEPLGHDPSGQPVFLRDLWPSRREVDEFVTRYVTPDLFQGTRTLEAFAEQKWASVQAPTGDLFPWDPASSYIVEPPFFEDISLSFGSLDEVRGARVLGVFEDGLTTDHVSPGGEIPQDSPAGQYLQSIGIAPANFNTYVGRRGNHHVLTRGTYANLRLRNQLVPDREGWWTRHYPDAEIVSFFEAAQRYRAAQTPVIVLAGRDFGSGSSRDWAAKGPALLGVGAVIARSFERIHRSNLIGLGILPLLFADGEGIDQLGLNGDEVFSLSGPHKALSTGAHISAAARRPDGTQIHFAVGVDTRTDAEVQTLLDGGVFRATLTRALAD